MTFDDWLNEVEVFSARWERMRADLPDADWHMLERWLRAAYDVGYADGYDDGHDDGYEDGQMKDL